MIHRSEYIGEAAAEPRLRERVLAVVGEALAAALAQRAERELVGRRAAGDVGVHVPDLAVGLMSVVAERGERVGVADATCAP